MLRNALRLMSFSMNIRMLIAVLCLLPCLVQLSSSQKAAPSAPKVRKIAEQSYSFTYPLVLMELTRRGMTLDGSPELLNGFNHVPQFPDDRFRQVIRPNADTLYSGAWLDLSKEPVLLHV